MGDTTMRFLSVSERMRSGRNNSGSEGSAAAAEAEAAGAADAEEAEAAAAGGEAGVAALAAARRAALFVAGTSIAPGDANGAAVAHGSSKAARDSGRSEGCM